MRNVRLIIITFLLLQLYIGIKKTYLPVIMAIMEGAGCWKKRKEKNKPAVLSLAGLSFTVLFHANEDTDGRVGIQNMLY